jgi:hypothetical protein
VEHSLPAYDLVRPWRTAAVVATLIAGVELLLILVAGTVWLVKPLFAAGDSTPQAALSQPAKARAAAIPLTRAETSVLVLNGSGASGAAATTADRVRARGYSVASVGNAPTTGYPVSVVMFRKGRRAEAVRLARDLRVARVVPVKGITARELMGAQVAFVVGAR